MRFADAFADILMVARQDWQDSLVTYNNSDTDGDETNDGLEGSVLQFQPA